MIQIITDSGKKFDLPEDLVISVEENSVMTGKQGSFSLPVDLPWSDNNVQLINYPSRIDRRHKFTTQIEVTVSGGVWVRRALLNVESAQEGTGISCELYFGESRFYSEIKDVDLPDVFKGIIRDDFSMYTELDTKIEMWLNYFEKVQTGEEEDDFFVFPICAGIENKEEVKEENGIKFTISYEEYKILNRPDVPTRRTAVIGDTSCSETNPYPGTLAAAPGGKSYYKLAAHKIIKVFKSLPELNEDDLELIIYQKGYGVTPFLKFTYILSAIFQKYGYSLQDSEFSTSPFSLLCYINNTADAIMDGKINYPHLVPDVKVVDFLEHIENSFGVEFIFNEIDNTVTPQFWKDLLVDAEAGSLDGALEDYPLLSYSQPKSVSLRTEKSAIDKKQDYNTYNELFEKYTIISDGAQLPEYINFCTLNKKYANYLCYGWRKVNLMGELRNLPFLIEKVPAVLDYHDNNYDIDDKQCGYESIMQVNVSMDELSPLTASVEVHASHMLLGLVDTMEETVTQQEDSVLAKIPRIKSIRHLKTAEVKTGKDAADVEHQLPESRKSESGDTLALYPCFFHGFAEALEAAPGVEHTFYGSQYMYDNAGNDKLPFDLTTKSLYEKFWQQYDEMIKTSFHELSGPACLPTEKMMMLKKHEPYILSGQKVLPETIQYELTHDGIYVADMKLRVLGAYE